MSEAEGGFGGQILKMHPSTQEARLKKEVDAEKARIFWENFTKSMPEPSEPFDPADLSREDVLILLKRCISKLQTYTGVSLFLNRVSHGSEEVDQDIKLLNKTVYILYSSTINTARHEEALGIIRKLNPKV